MSNYILIKVTNNINRFIDKCKSNNFELYNITYIKKDIILVKIKKEDFENIKRYNYYSDIEEYKKLGIDNLIDKIYSLKYFILTFIICIILMILSSKIILKIEVIHSNKEVRELLINELESYGIKKFSIKKDFYKIENIKNKILENNKDTLEWISIENIGMTYKIRVEERIKDSYKSDKEYCNIISTKDAIITNIYSTKGEILVNVNDYVHKGDVLISGDIYLNEELTGSMCASGIIYGKVWYNTSINLDLNYQKKEYTKNKRYNLKINNKILFKEKYKNYDKEYIIKNKFIELYKEKEYNIKTYKYNIKEAENLALKEIDNKFKEKLNNNGVIIDKKILKKEINNNKIYMDVFVVTNEIISKDA